MSTAFLHTPKLTLIVKPTVLCNANCLYCSSQRADGLGLKMSDETLALLFKRVEDYCAQCSIRHVELIWHGGEPLLMKPEFYERVAEHSTSLSSLIDITHGIQTNLLLFNGKFVPAFRRLGMKLSTSADPMRGIRLVDGVDSLDIWIEKLQDAVRFGFHVGIICVIHKRHMISLSEVFQYFENLYALTGGRIGLRFNTLYRAGRARNVSLYDDLGITPEECGEIFVRLWEWWDKGGRILSHAPPMSEWAHMFEETEGGKGCSHCENCAAGWLGIDGEGNVYNCGRHMESGSPYGNIHTATLSEIVLNPERTKLYQRSELLKLGECKECPIWYQCYGGCPDDAFLYTGDRMLRSHWCKSYRTFYEKVFLRR